MGQHDHLRVLYYSKSRRQELHRVLHFFLLAMLAQTLCSHHDLVGGAAGAFAWGMEM